MKDAKNATMLENKTLAVTGKLNQGSYKSKLTPSAIKFVVGLEKCGVSIVVVPNLGTPCFVRRKIRRKGERSREMTR